MYRAWHFLTKFGTVIALPQWECEWCASKSTNIATKHPPPCKRNLTNRKNPCHDLQFKNGELTQDAADAIDKWQTLHEHNEGLSKDMESAKAVSHDLCLALSDLQKDLQKKEEEVETMKEWIEGQDATHSEENLK